MIFCDVPVNSKAHMESSSILKICHLNILEVLTGTRVRCVRVCVSIYIVFCRKGVILNLKIFLQLKQPFEVHLVFPEPNLFIFSYGEYNKFYIDTEKIRLALLDPL